LKKQKAQLAKAAKPDTQELARVNKELGVLNLELGKLQKAAQGNIDALRRKQADMLEDKADLLDVQKAVIDGWKFDRARSTEALEVAKKTAERFVGKEKPSILKLASELNVKPFSIQKVSRMYPDRINEITIDYGKAPIPKDKIEHPREDMIDQAFNLYDLKEPIKIGTKELYETNKQIKDLDDINKDLFDKLKPAGKGNFVQILTNKPRSAFYIAIVDGPPRMDRDQKVEFENSLRLASRPENADEMRFRQINLKGILKDRFVERVQVQDATLYRQSLVESLKKTLNFTPGADNAKATFDDRAVGD